jgi:hypothetical protein
MNISHLERFNGQLWATHETCDCGAKSNPHYPGAVVKAWKDHYQDFPVDYPPLYPDDTA